MKMLVQQLRNGIPQLWEVPVPQVRAGYLLIQTTCSAVSGGTENMLLRFGKSNWLQKARQQPAQVRLVLEKVQKDGLAATWASVKAKLETPVAMGYCNAGRVIAVGTGVTDFKVGDRVASNGPHAQIVSVPQNLVQKIPDGVSEEAAAFTPLAAIALHGIRLAQPTFGETFVVLGLGTVGNLAAQLLAQHGCKVIGFDTDLRAVERAQKMGIEAALLDAVSAALVSGSTNGLGADGVLIATASESTEPIRFAAEVARAGGRLVLIGTADIQIDRNLFFKKELKFTVSSSYGPGRYDPAYEEKGQDYPAAQVRWTAGRNFSAVLQAMRSGNLQVEPLIGDRLAIEDFEQAYAGGGKAYGTAVFRYSPVEIALPEGDTEPKNTVGEKPAGRGIGVIGAGSFAQGMLLPLLQKEGVSVAAICSAGGLSAGVAAKKFGIGQAVSDARQLLSDSAINSVFILTRHHQHAQLTADALAAGKHVFVEKPLALSEAELEQVTAAYAGTSAQILTVGFNRRFAPLGGKMKALFPSGSPLHLIYNINAGALPPGHWTADTETGGGRLLGEVCHFTDFALWLAGSEVETVFALRSGGPAGNENYAVTLHFRSGATAVINYFTGGSGRYQKERMEVHGLGQTAVLDNWRRLEWWSGKAHKVVRGRQDKGHRNLLRAHLAAIAGGGVVPISFEELVHSTRVMLAAMQSVRMGRTERV